MPVVALVTWIVTALGGLYLLAIWLIEYDPDFQRAAATRLPVPVVSGHVLFAVGGLVVWLMYLITDEDIFRVGDCRRPGLRRHLRSDDGGALDRRLPLLAAPASHAANERPCAWYDRCRARRVDAARFLRGWQHAGLA